MATTARNTIEVLHATAGPKKEALASGAITPGMMLERTSAAAATVKAHATAGGFAGNLFAVEDDLQGNEIATAYVSAARAFFRVFRSGDEVYALLANGESVAIGAALMSDGAGALKAAMADSSATLVEAHVVATALEAVDMSDSSAADPATARILVEIL